MIWLLRRASHIFRNNNFGQYAMISSNISLRCFEFIVLLLLDSMLKWHVIQVCHALPGGKWINAFSKGISMKWKKENRQEFELVSPTSLSALAFVKHSYSLPHSFFLSLTYTHRIPFYILQIFPPRRFTPPSFTNMVARVRPTPMSICRCQCKYKLSVISLLFTNFYWPTSSPLIYAFINYFPSDGTYIYWELKERFVKRISAHHSKHYLTSP